MLEYSTVALPASHAGADAAAAHVIRRGCMYGTIGGQGPCAGGSGTSQMSRHAAAEGRERSRWEGRRAQDVSLVSRPLPERTGLLPVLGVCNHLARGKRDILEPDKHDADILASGDPVDEQPRPETGEGERPCDADWCAEG